MENQNISEEKTSAAPVEFERLINAPLETVWKALTDKEQMKKWYFDVKNYQLKLGCEFSFVGGKEGREYLHLCKITRLEVGKVLAYTWRYDGLPGNSEVTFQLTARGEQTLLKLTHSGLESFAGIHEDFDKKNFVEGWAYILGTGLPKYLECGSSHNGSPCGH